MKIPLLDKIKRKINRADANGDNSGADSANESRGRAHGTASRAKEALSHFFSAEPHKEKVLKYEDFDAAGDTYYATVSAFYKVGQRVLWVACALFAIISVIFNFRDITYDNFFYLIKDFNTAVDTESISYETLSYDSSQNQSFTLYRGGLSVVSPSNVSLFTATGRRTLNSNSSYSMPYCVSSDKYLLVYDTGGSSFAIYNSFAKVYDEDLGYPVTDACFSDSGKFAVLTREADYKAIVIVYNKNFDRIAKFSRDYNATDISIDSEGNRLAVVYFDSGDGSGRTTLAYYDLKTGDKITEYEFAGEFPLGCTFLESGALGVVTTGAVRIFDKNGESGTRHSFAPKNVAAFCLDKNGIAVALNNGIISDRNQILVFDKKGELLYNETVRSGAEQIALSDGYVFLKNSSGVLRLNLGDSSGAQLDCQKGRMLVYDSKTVLVCAESKAVYLNFGN
ncbi:MAG: DUF5711 family protein [Eubacteriales bacterium]